MKYIKTYEGSTEITIEEIKQLQFCKLAILNFSKKISEAFFNGSILKEQDTPHGYITGFRLSFHSETILVFNISANRKIQIYVDSFTKKVDKSDFYDFIFHYLNRNKINQNYFLFTSSELNKLAENLLEEWEIYRDVKKYNL